MPLPMSIPYKVAKPQGHSMFAKGTHTDRGAGHSVAAHFFSHDLFATSIKRAIDISEHPKGLPLTQGRQNTQIHYLLEIKVKQAGQWTTYSCPKTFHTETKVCQTD